MIFILSALWWIRIRGLWRLPVGRYWLRRKLDLVLMGGAMLRNFYSNFLLMGTAVFPLWCLIWAETMVETMKIMSICFKMFFAGTAMLNATNPAAGYCWTVPPPETPQHSQASLGLSTVGQCSYHLDLGAHKVLSVSSKCLVPVLWKICNQIPLPSKVKFPGDSQSLCQIPRLGNL